MTSSSPKGLKKCNVCGEVALWYGHTKPREVRKKVNELPFFFRRMQYLYQNIHNSFARKVNRFMGRTVIREKDMEFLVASVQLGLFLCTDHAIDFPDAEPIFHKDSNGKLWIPVFKEL